MQGQLKSKWNSFFDMWNIKVEITFIILKIIISPTAPASKGLACNKSAYLER